jgi:hypothetical protein
MIQTRIAPGHRAAEDTTRALQLWNGGANPDYATQVLARVEKYRNAGASLLWRRPCLRAGRGRRYETARFAA